MSEIHKEMIEWRRHLKECRENENQTKEVSK